jgi:TonB family protein
MNAAPEVLTSDNPYAATSAGVFTSGRATSSSPIVSQAATTHPTFGVTGGAARSDAEKAKELRSWYGRVQTELARLGTRNYPRRALKLGQQGTPKVTVTIDESGNLVGASLAAGSGVASLDQAALQALQSISKVSAPPPGSGTNRLTVPVTFRIN